MTTLTTAYDGGRRVTLIGAAAIVLSGAGLVAESTTATGPDFVGIAALISSIGGLGLGSVAAVAAWRKKPPAGMTPEAVEAAEIAARVAARLLAQQQGQSSDAKRSPQ